MNTRKVLIAFALSSLLPLAAHTQGPPFAAGLQAPTRMIFTPQGNLVVAESGTTAKNSGRISIIDRTSGARRTLIDGLPSGISGSGGEAAPSGPSGVARSGLTTLYVSIGAGDGVLPGPVPGSERANDAPASSIISSLLSLTTSASLDLMTGGFTLLPPDHARLKSGETVTLTNANNQTLGIKLLADFPNFTAAPRPDFADNVRASNPFGVAVRANIVFVVDASQNIIRTVDTTTGTVKTLTTFAPLPNPLPFGPPVIDPVPDSVTLRGDNTNLLVTTLTGFPFPAGGASVYNVDRSTGAITKFLGNLTSAIDVQPLGNQTNDPVAVLEFSTSMTENAPGRLRMIAADGTSTTLAEGLPTPTSIAVDQRTGEIFVAHIFPGFITRVNVAGRIPEAGPSAIIPVVASLPGAFGSHYTTSMQVTNPHPFAISGRFVVHPQGRIGVATDPSIAYTLAPFETKRYADFLSTAGVSGGGSVDVLAAVGSAPVTVTTIVDVGADGMPLIQVPQVTTDVVTQDAHGTLVAPADPSHARFNIGIRTLSGGASLTFHVHDASGADLRTTTLSLPGNFFQQYSAASLLGGALTANQSITITVDGADGAAIVYGVAIDNVTGDATLQIARRTSE